MLLDTCIEAVRNSAGTAWGELVLVGSATVATCLPQIGVEIASIVFADRTTCWMTLRFVGTTHSIIKINVFFILCLYKNIRYLKNVYVNLIFHNSFKIESKNV